MGLAIGEVAVTAVLKVREVVHRADETLPADALEDAAVLAAALRAAGARLEVLAGLSLESARVHVALLPPLADARLVQLPPLRAREAEAVLRRDAARHFVGGAGARVVAVAPARSRADGGVPPMFAAAAPLAAVEAVRGAVAAAGWQLEAIVPAQAAWLAALPATGHNRSAAASAVIAVHDDAAHVIRREGGVVTVVRRMPAAWRDEVVGAAGAAPGTAMVLGDTDEREPVARALRSAGWTVEGAGPADAAESAARFAAATSMELTPPLLAAARRAGQRSLGARIAVAAVLLLAGAAVLELWGTRRELESVRARRAEIRDEVTPLLATRDSLARLDDRIATIRALDTNAPRWTRAVFDLAMLLPPDARLTRLTTSGDTIYVEAAGARAGAALQALRDASSLQDMRLDGAVNRDLLDGATVVERFRVRARLAPSESWTPGANGPVRDGALRERAGQERSAVAPEPERSTPASVRRSM